MHNLFLVYFVNLYMFRAYLGPSSGDTTVCVQQLVLILLDDCCPTRTVVPPDDGPRYARNMYRLTEYTKNKLYIKLVFLYTIELHPHVSGRKENFLIS
jgi:hypothetical protein